ncbi:sensor histidine kinase [Leucobacter albus]|uniref:histidine kinase n=1 Tax=Leucobacter albus TaxID=272210 RepID=A0ABW3TLM3_9MICO
MTNTPTELLPTTVLEPIPENSAAAAPAASGAVPAAPTPGSAPEPAPEGPHAPSRLRTMRTRTLPARWRITVWIVLSTLFTLCAIALIGRSLSLATVEVEANAQITQEAEEFTRFVTEGVDPETTKPFATPQRLLEVYLSRQSVSDGELIVGLVEGAPVGTLSGVPGRGTGSTGTTGTGATGTGSTGSGSGTGTGTGDAGTTPAPTPSPTPGADAAMLKTMTDPERRSGTGELSDGEPVRWGRVDFLVGEHEGALLIAHFTAADRQAVDRAVGTLAWVAAAGLLLCSGVAWLVAGQILAPVREVYRVARDITEHDLTARVPVEGSDDIAQVAATFNEMLDRLEEAHRTQQRFVDDAGHELRTPITIVRGHLELLSEDPEERRATLRLVSDELARMSRIVSDLLVLARAQQHDFVRLAAHDIAALTLDIEAKAQALGDRRWQLMEVAEGEAEVDAQRVTQAVLQLAANAVQVTDAGDRIRIGSRFDGHGAERRLNVWVADEGPGVSEQAATRIFERFVHGGHVSHGGHVVASAAPGATSDSARSDTARSDTAGSSPRHGSGLGLAIVRAITDGHGGSAWVESTLGEGATFGMDLPAPELASAAETQRAAADPSPTSRQAPAPPAPSHQES